jgi:7-carboxy-7-deazaguanine synthase
MSMAGSSGMLRVAETFGPTVQGEGPSAGRPAVFVRLSGCNLDCSWCDTPYTWDWKRFDQVQESRETPVPEIAEWVLAHDVDVVVITGGEPLIQQRRLAPLVARLHVAGRWVEIETNGTIAPAAELIDHVGRFNVSPKLAGCGVPEQRRIRPVALRALSDSGKAVFKFVITGPADVEELVAVQARFGLAPVLVMPEGMTADRVLAGLRTLAEPAIKHGWAITPRLHVLLWGDQRGR